MNDMILYFASFLHFVATGKRCGADRFFLAGVIFTFIFKITLLII